MRYANRHMKMIHYGAAAAFNKVELESLQLMCAGLTDQEIADALGKSLQQIRHYLRTAKEFSDSANRVGLVVWCVQNGIFRVKVAA